MSLHRLALSILFIVHAGAERSTRTTRNLEPGDAPAQGNALAPEFDEIALVRRKQMMAAGISKAVAEEAIKKFETKGSVMDSIKQMAFGLMPWKLGGIKKKEWETIAPQLVAFNQVCGNGATIGFGDFTRLSLTYGWVTTPQTSTWPTKTAAVHQIMKRGPYTKTVAKKVAEDFLQSSEKDEAKLDLFMKLDAKHVGKLSLKQLIPVIEPKALSTDLQWAQAARIEREDFVAWGLPNVMAKDILKLFGSSQLSYADYEDKRLFDVITEFARRDRLGIASLDQDTAHALPHKDVKKKTSTTQDPQGTLKFYQIASILPSLTRSSNDEGGFETNKNVGHVSIWVPSIKDVTGEENRLEVQFSDITNWLQKKGKVNNGIISKSAEKVARNIVAFSDGALGRKPNARISFSEWGMVAGRMGLFLAMADEEGKLHFNDAYRFILKWINDGKPGMEVEASSSPGCVGSRLTAAIALGQQAISSGRGKKVAAQEINDALDELRGNWDKATEISNQLVGR